MRENHWQTEVEIKQQREKKARQILGISDSGGKNEIKRAWRQKSLNCHPDHNPNDTESTRKFILVNCAYRCLCEGLLCEELDNVELEQSSPVKTKYRRDNLWGYFAWWSETYF